MPGSAEKAAEQTVVARGNYLCLPYDQSDLHLTITGLFAVLQTLPAPLVLPGFQATSLHSGMKRAPSAFLDLAPAGTHCRL